MFDTMDNDDDTISFESEIGEEPPEVSIGSILLAFRTRGFVDTMNDEAMGPHTHLFVLLSIIFFIAIIIGLAQLAI